VVSVSLRTLFVSVFCTQRFLRPLISCVVLGRALHAIIRLGIYSGLIWTLDEGSNSVKRPAGARKHRIVCSVVFFVSLLGFSVSFSIKFFSLFFLLFFLFSVLSKKVHTLTYGSAILEIQTHTVSRDIFKIHIRPSRPPRSDGGKIDGTIPMVPDGTTVPL
jgi:hypothetical protein